MTESPCFLLFGHTTQYTLEFLNGRKRKINKRSHSTSMEGAEMWKQKNTFILWIDLARLESLYKNYQMWHGESKIIWRNYTLHHTKIKLISNLELIIVRNECTYEGRLSRFVWGKIMINTCSRKVCLITPHPMTTPCPQQISCSAGIVSFFAVVDEVCYMWSLHLRWLLGNWFITVLQYF